MKKYLSILVLALLVSFQSCKESKEAQENQEVEAVEDTRTKASSEDKKIMLLNREQLDKSLDRIAGMQLVDVRTPEEYNAGHIRRSVNIDINNALFKEKLAELNLSKAVYVYCQKGSRSGRATQMLIEMGVPRVYDLEGGFSAWEADGYAVEK